MPTVCRASRHAHDPVSKKDTEAPTRVSVFEPACRYVIVLNSLAGSVATLDDPFRLPAVGAPARTGFVHDDLRETGKHRFETVPYPNRDVFAGGIGQSISLIE